MDEQSKAILESILASDKETLSRDQWEFLMARRSYLNDEQRKRFGDEIKLHEKGQFFKEEEAAEGTLEAMSMKDLAKKAKELGIKGIKSMDKKALIKAIEAATDEDAE